MQIFQKRRNRKYVSCLEPVRTNSNEFGPQDLGSYSGLALPTSPPPAYGSPAGPYVANGPSPWAAPPGPPAVPASLPYGLPASPPAWPPAPVAARQEVCLQAVWVEGVPGGAIHGVELARQAYVRRHHLIDAL